MPTRGRDNMMYLLGAIATALTFCMFLTKASMLGFACSVFWALFGGYAYTLSSSTWDIYYMTAFASLLGMTTFTALGAYGLRERRDTLGDEAMEGGGGSYIDEDEREDTGSQFFENNNETPPLTRSQRLKDRAKLRRVRVRGRSQ